MPTVDPYAPPKARKRKRKRREEVPAREIRSTHTVGLVAIVLFAAQLSLQGIVHVIDLVSFSDIEARQVSEAAVTAEQVASRIGTACRLIGIVFFLIWIYRAAANARDLRPEATEIRPGLAVGSFFIPVAMLWMPYRSMSEIVRWSNPNSTGITPPIVLGWWLAFLGGNVCRSIGGRLDDLTALLGFGALSTGLLTVALVLLARLMRGVEGGQAELAKQPKEVVVPSLPDSASPTPE